ncbi:iron/zinc/copper transport system substrate-binding protein [Natranaerovirga pectinivora]|uniref:Iron/zinc/copper transport system substrate-binding protein n=1 Tax=Natranaerovirga pectinivora TaxID=682400 RepID=A0A4R3MPM7_9FIRM|nr:zinc ABC transporter substrate-binding protein [Natranaerovirga pectinivora]TCT14932.1 iron/zinc/copper transport system substrate-binding protein [Natranaerovirga pectinivora]
MYLKRGKQFFLLSIVSAFILLTACSQKSENNNKSDQLDIVTTISIIADLVENIVGDKGVVEFIVPVGDNPEDYELISSDLMKVNNADILFMNGWGLEEVIERGLTNVTNVNIVHLTEGITPINLVGEDVPDPHAWFDVSLVANYYVQNILGELKTIDADNSEYYDQNAKAYISQLEALDTWIKEEIEKIPEKNRVIIISENALKYYGEAYGFKTEGIWELNSHSEGTPQQISRIVDLVRAIELPALFIETTVDERYMEMISNETNVPIAGAIYTDALGKPGSDGETYIKMLRYNTELFVEGLSK